MPGLLIRSVQTADSRRLLGMEGSPGLLSTADEFRLVFAGINLDSACQSNVRLISGDPNGTYDVPHLSSCGFSIIDTSIVVVHRFATIPCSGATTAFNQLGASLSVGGVSIAVGLRVPNVLGIGGVTFFRCNIPICDFEQGMEVANAITAFGVDGFDRAFGKDGTVTITRQCP